MDNPVAYTLCYLYLTPLVIACILAYLYYCWQQKRPVPPVAGTADQGLFLVLLVYLGAFGAHNFYLKKSGRAFFNLGCSCGIYALFTSAISNSAEPVYYGLCYAAGLGLLLAPLATDLLLVLRAPQRLGFTERVSVETTVKTFILWGFGVTCGLIIILLLMILVGMALENEQKFVSFLLSGIPRFISFLKIQVPHIFHAWCIASLTASLVLIFYRKKQTAEQTWPSDPELKNISNKNFVFCGISLGFLGAHQLYLRRPLAAAANCLLTLLILLLMTGGGVVSLMEHANADFSSPASPILFTIIGLLAAIPTFSWIPALKLPPRDGQPMLQNPWRYLLGWMAANYLLLLIVFVLSIPPLMILLALFSFFVAYP